MTHLCPDGNLTCWNTAGHLTWEPLVGFLLGFLISFSIILWWLR